MAVLEKIRASMEDVSEGSIDSLNVSDDLMGSPEVLGLTRLPSGMIVVSEGRNSGVLSPVHFLESSPEKDSSLMDEREDREKEKMSMGPEILRERCLSPGEIVVMATEMENVQCVSNIEPADPPGEASMIGGSASFRSEFCHTDASVDVNADVNIVLSQSGGNGEVEWDRNGMEDNQEIQHLNNLKMNLVDNSDQKNKITTATDDSVVVADDEDDDYDVDDGEVNEKMVKFKCNSSVNDEEDSSDYDGLNIIKDDNVRRLQTDARHEYFSSSSPTSNSDDPSKSNRQALTKRLEGSNTHPMSNSPEGHRLATDAVFDNVELNDDSDSHATEESASKSVDVMGISSPPSSLLDAPLDALNSTRNPETIESSNELFGNNVEMVCSPISNDGDGVDDYGSGGDAVEGDLRGYGVVGCGDDDDSRVDDDEDEPNSSSNHQTNKNDSNSQTRHLVSSNMEGKATSSGRLPPSSKGRVMTNIIRI